MYKLTFEQQGTLVLLNTMKSLNDGKDWTLHANEALDANEIPDDVKEKVLSYGLLKLVQDRNSSITAKYLEEDLGQAKGSEEAVQTRIDFYKQTFDMFMGGEWKKEVVRAIGNQVDPVLAQVVCDALNEGKKKADQVSLMAVTAKLKGMAKEERQALKDKFKDAYAALKREQAEQAANLDLSELL